MFQPTVLSQSLFSTQSWSLLFTVIFRLKSPCESIQICYSQCKWFKQRDLYEPLIWTLIGQELIVHSAQTMTTSRRDEQLRSENNLYLTSITGTSENRLIGRRIRRYKWKHQTCLLLQKHSGGKSGSPVTRSVNLSRTRQIAFNVASSHPALLIFSLS